MWHSLRYASQSGERNHDEVWVFRSPRTDHRTTSGMRVLICMLMGVLTMRMLMRVSRLRPRPLQRAYGVHATTLAWHTMLHPWPAVPHRKIPVHEPQVAPTDRGKEKAVLVV